MAIDVTIPVVVGDSGPAAGVTGISVTLTADIPASTPDSASVIMAFYTLDFAQDDVPPDGVIVSDDAEPGLGGNGAYAGPNFVLGQQGPLGGSFGGPQAAFVIPGTPNHGISSGAVPWMLLEALSAGQALHFDFGGATNIQGRILLVALQGLGSFNGACAAADAIYLQSDSGGGPSQVIVESANSENLEFQPSAVWEEPPDTGSCVALYMVSQARDASGGWGGWVDPAVTELGSWVDESADNVSAVIGYRTFDITDTSTFDTGNFSVNGGSDGFNACMPVFFKPGFGPGFCSTGFPYFNHRIAI